MMDVTEKIATMIMGIIITIVVLRFMKNGARKEVMESTNTNTESMETIMAMNYVEIEEVRVITDMLHVTVMRVFTDTMGSMVLVVIIMVSNMNGVMMMVHML